jgi:hydrogenase/urease accessory protein HupE
MRLVALLLFVTLVAPRVARAHHNPLSSLTISVEPRAVRMVAVVPADELAIWSPAAPDQTPEQYAAAVARRLQDEAADLFELRLNYNVVSPSDVHATSDDPQVVRLEMLYPPPDDDAASITALQVFSNLVTKLSKDHQQVTCVQDARQPGATPRIVAWLTLTPTRFSGFADLASTAPAPAPSATTTAPTAPQAPPPAAGVSFFRLGVEHILTGYDHLLFLAALLLVCASFREAATIITCFTVAHSVTLALAALDVVRVPSRVVEPIIAASIVYVALENVLAPGEQKARLIRRAAVTFAFGLVHGLGFASVLRELGLGSTPDGVLLPLVKFNLGVEAGQLAVASVLFPLILLARARASVRHRLVPVCSVLIAMVGAYWLFERIASA